MVRSSLTYGTDRLAGNCINGRLIVSQAPDFHDCITRHSIDEHSKEYNEEQD